MRFMIKTAFKEPPTEEVLALIPVELAKAKELEAQGIHKTLYVAADLSNAWTIWDCESQAVLEEIHETLPLHKYLNMEITLLSEDF